MNSSSRNLRGKWFCYPPQKNASGSVGEACKFVRAMMTLFCTNLQPSAKGWPSQGRPLISSTVLTVRYFFLHQMYQSLVPLVCLHRYMLKRRNNGRNKYFVMLGWTVDLIPNNASRAPYYTELIRCPIIQELLKIFLVHLFILNLFVMWKI